MLERALKDAVRYHWTPRLADANNVERVVVSSGQGAFEEQGKPVDFVGTLGDVTESDRLRARARHSSFARLASHVPGVGCVCSSLVQQLFCGTSAQIDRIS